MSKEPIKFENPLHAFFCIMQEPNLKLRLEALRALQGVTKEAAVRDRIAREIPRIERLNKWGEVAQRFPEPPSAA